MNEPTIVFNLVKVLKESILAIEMSWLKVGAILCEIRDKELYRQYAEHTTSMSEFLREIDIGMGLSQANHLMRIFKTFSPMIGERVIPMKRLLLIHPLVAKQPEQIEYWVEQAEHLPMQGLVSAVQEAKGQTPQDQCEHLELDFYSRCRACGAWFKLNEQPNRKEE